MLQIGFRTTMMHNVIDMASWAFDFVSLGCCLNRKAF